MEKYSISRKECRMRENAAYLVPETLKVKNVACLLSDRSMGRTPHTSFRRRSRPRIRVPRGERPSLCSVRGKRHSLLEKLKVWLWLSGEIAWATVGWVVDAEPGFISSGWVGEEGTGTTAKFIAIFKHT